ncbi:MAG: hypothetical protein LIQ30_05615 [Planctomycetes bacterium]|nr:hypothetical protein [Planctomycetota bacterium]
MAEAPRPRPVEYTSPRPLILGLCFFWGIAVGFCFFYFAPPKQMTDQGQSGSAATDAAPQATMSEIERRHIATPNITPVEPTPEAVVDDRPRLETMEMEPPTPVLTTEGGLTGRTAHLLLPTTPPSSAAQSPFSTAPAQPATPSRPSGGMTPPPIPELMP